ncbi:MAG: 16S rRNA (guanine(966)-N(2))-methyltransferase RsmD [Oscillospiraceae bacterium]|jgi:16S rRNA G966 N2-methylase RsmD|nr:16S rRNA (guanine(966)-N(2))-methyltransferase RsmD [Oscillospiraceae bacterium]
MRVITGTARGKRLQTLAGDSIRPTAAGVKESLFSAIQFEISGRNALDLFAGSGQLGIEALSRGAAGAVFADRDKHALAVARRNAEDCGFAETAAFVQTDALVFLSGTAKKFSLVFLDPPYKKQETEENRQEQELGAKRHGRKHRGQEEPAGLSLLEEALQLLPRVLEEDAIVCAESPVQQALPTVLGKLAAKEYRYGKTKLTIYRP